MLDAGETYRERRRTLSASNSLGYARAAASMQYNKRVPFCLLERLVPRKRWHMLGWKPLVQWTHKDSLHIPDLEPRPYHRMEYTIEPDNPAVSFLE